MREIIVLSHESEISKLRTLFALAGADAVYPRDLNETLELLERTEPCAVFVSENAEPSAPISLRELKRHSPSVPVCVLMSKRDEETERYYIRHGAFSCIKYPWTPEDASQVLKIARKPLLKKLEFKERKKYTKTILSAVFILAISISYFSYIYGFKSAKEKILSQNKNDTVRIHLSHPSGIFFSKDKVFVYDWLLQSAFSYRENDKTPMDTVKIPGEIYTYAADFFTQAVFLSDEGIIHRRAKDKNLSVLEKAGPFKDFSQFCFDGVYVWTLDEKNKILSQRINNKDLEKIKDYPVSKIPILFSCSQEKFYYLYEGHYDSALLKDPEKIIYSAKYSLQGIPYAFAQKDGVLWIVHGSNGEYFLTSISERQKKH